MASLQSFRSQLTRLRRLSQPYFLPYTDSNGWQFALLLFSLLFCVAGTVLGLLSGLMALLGVVWPQVTAQYLGGVQGSIAAIWSLPIITILSWGQLSLAIYPVALVVSLICQDRLRRGFATRSWLYYPAPIVAWFLTAQFAVSALFALAGVVAPALTTGQLASVVELLKQFWTIPIGTLSPLLHQFGLSLLCWGQLILLLFCLLYTSDADDE